MDPRRFSVAVVLACARAGLAVVVCGIALPAGGQEESPGPAPLARWERVRLKLEVRGDIFAPVGEGGREVRKPFTSTARFDFLEARPAVDAAAAGEAETTPAVPHGAVAVRHFFSAASELVLEGDVVRRSLRPDLSTLAVASRPSIRHFAVAEPLTHEESELLSLAFDPLLLEALVPVSADAADRPDWVAALLAIDTIGRAADDGASAGQSPRGLRIDREAATEDGGGERIRLGGKIDGAVDGVPTTIEVDGTLDIEPGGDRLRSGFVTVRERRLAGHVSAGFDCEATLQFARRPADVAADPPLDAGSKDLVESTWRHLVSGESSVGPDRVAYRDPTGRYTLEHDPRWRPVSEDARGVVLRFIDDGALVAECTVSALPPSAPGTTVDAFKEDVARSLGSSLAKVVSADETPRDDGCRHLRVVAEGSEGDVPLEWRHHLLEGPRGSRLSATFVIERRFLGRFATADADFIAGAVVGAGSAP